MTIANEITGNDPTAGENAGAPSDPVASGTQAPPAPAARTYSDSDMANARRSWEATARREREAALAAIRSEYESRSAPKPADDDPWSEFDPQVAARLKAALERTLQTHLSPLKQAQNDLAFARDENEMRTKYSDYSDNRAAILQFAVENGIRNLDTAYRAWKYDSLSKIDPKAIARDAVAEHIKKKQKQSAETPAVEGRGGGAPSSAKKYKDRDEMEADALDLITQANAQ
jgi:hypothetical protein